MVGIGKDDKQELPFLMKIHSLSLYFGKKKWYYSDIMTNELQTKRLIVKKAESLTKQRGVFLPADTDHSVKVTNLPYQLVLRVFREQGGRQRVSLHNEKETIYRLDVTKGREALRSALTDLKIAFNRLRPLRHSARQSLSTKGVTRRYDDNWAETRITPDEALEILRLQRGT